MLNTCQAQRQFIKQSIGHNVRIDGRKNNTRRTPILRNNVISHLPGSSYAYLEYEQVQIYTGIKIKVQQTNITSNSNEIILELSSMRKLRDEQNQQMLKIQSVLEERLIKQIAKCKEIEQFLTISGAKKHKLFMYIDVFLLVSPHISLLQLIVESIKYALNSTSISEIEVSYNQVTEEQTAEMTKTIRKFTKNNWQQPVIIGLVESQNGPLFIIDMKRQQYQSADACFLINIDEDKVTYFQSLKGTCSIDTINKCVKYALSNWSKKGKE